MIEKLAEIEKDIQELDRLLASPEVYKDPKTAARLSRAEGTHPLITALRSTKKAGCMKKPPRCSRASSTRSSANLW